MGNMISCVPCSRGAPQALLSMPEFTLHELAARCQVMTEPLNMQAKEIIDTIAKGAMHAANVPRPEFKDITDQDKQEGLIFMSPAAWNEFVTKTSMIGGNMLWTISRFE